MAQVMVNFRIDEDVKKNMELACREMGLSMTTAFTIFAKKVGNEKRIPFEITAEPQRTGPYRQQSPRRDAGQAYEEEPLLLAHRQERLERLYTEIRRSLTSIHTAIPASITGLSMEGIRLLCGNELKDKIAAASNSARTLFSSRNSELLRKKDLGVLDEYIDGLSSVSDDLLELEHTLIPTMKAWNVEDSVSFEPYEQRLAGVSQSLDGLSAVMQRFLNSTACTSGARGVRLRLQQAARPIETPYVRTALDNLEASILQHFGALDEQTQKRLESDYLQTLELTLRELNQAEQENGDVGGTAALCLRTINVLTQVIAESRQTRQEWSGRRLEAEVAALERLAAMRGDIAGGIKAEG